MNKTLLNFLAILLIIGAVLALHALGKRFVFSDKGQVNAQKAETKAEAANQNTGPAAPVKAIPAATLEPLQNATGTPKTPAEDIKDEKARAAEPTAAAAQSEKPVTRKHATVNRRASSARAGRTGSTEDHYYSVENLDNEQARRRYLETSKVKGATKTAPETRTATYNTYTMPEPAPQRNLQSYAQDDLDGAAAREQYRKKNEELSSAKLK